VRFEINLIVGDFMGYPPPASKVSKFAPPVDIRRRRESSKQVSTNVRATNLLMINSIFYKFEIKEMKLKKEPDLVNEKELKLKFLNLVYP
jgi:hypothetical protein